MVAQTQSVLLSHAKIIRLVLRGLLEVLRGQSEQPSRVSRPRRRGGAPFRTALPSHAHMDRNIIRRQQLVVDRDVSQAPVPEVAALPRSSGSHRRADHRRSSTPLKSRVQLLPPPVLDVVAQPLKFSSTFLDVLHVKFLPAWQAKFKRPSI
jgi:hypothetical protein